MRDGGSSATSGRLGQLCLLLAYLDITVVDGAADSVAASSCTGQVELVSRLADMRIVVTPARIKPFDLTYNLVQQILAIVARQRDVRRAAIPFSIVLDANTEARGLAVEHTIARKLDSVGANRHRPALISHAAKRDELVQADGSSVGLVAEFKVTLDTTQASFHPLCGQAELDLGFIAVTVTPLPFPLLEAAGSLTAIIPPPVAALRRHSLYFGSVTSKISRPLSVQPV